MFGISSFELLIIILVAVVALGPERMPRIIRLVHRLASEFRRVSTDLQRAVNLETPLGDHVSLKKQAEDLLFGDAPKHKPERDVPKSASDPGSPEPSPKTQTDKGAA